MPKPKPRPATEPVEVVETYVPAEKIRNAAATGFELGLALAARRLVPVAATRGVDLDRRTTLTIERTPGGDLHIRLEGVKP